MTEKLGFLKALNSIIVVMPTVEGKALLEQHNLINLFSKEWEKRCRAATHRYSRLDEKKITEAEKRWRVKQLWKELVFTDTKR